MDFFLFDTYYKPEINYQENLVLLISLYRQRPSLCNSQVVLLQLFFRGLVSVHSRYCQHGRSVASDSLHQELRQLCCLRRRVDCYRWSEPVSWRDSHPMKSSAFHGALLRQQGVSLKRRASGAALSLRPESIFARLNVECFRLVALAFKRAHVASATVLRVGTRHAALIGFQQMSQPILAATRVSGINGRTTREQRNSWRWPAVVR